MYVFVLGRCCLVILHNIGEGIFPRNVVLQKDINEKQLRTMNTACLEGTSLFRVLQS